MPQVSSSELEKNFGDLANTQLRDKAPQLLDYLLGFETRAVEEDGSKATGLFGFEIDGKIHLAPVWFMNGEIRGPFQLYSIDEDMFRPMSDEVLNELLRKPENKLGQRDGKSDAERGVRNPDYSRFRQIPGGVGQIKTAAQKLETVSPEGRAALPCTEVLASLPEHRQLKIAQALWAPGVAELTGTFYSTNDFTMVPTLRKVAAEKEKLIIVDHLAGPGSQELSQAEREKVVAGGLGIMDKRPDVAKSKLYRTETETNLESPTGPGLYQVLNGMGELCPMLILQNFRTVAPHEKLMAVRCEDGRAAWVANTLVQSLRQETRQAFEKASKDASVELDDLRVGDAFSPMDDTGAVMPPVVVQAINTGRDGIVSIVLSGPYYDLPQLEQRRVSGPAYCTGIGMSSDIREILVTDRQDHMPAVLRDRVILSRKHWRALKLNHRKQKFDESSSSWYDRKPEDVVLTYADFGDMSTIREGLSKIAREITVWRDGESLSLRDHQGEHRLTKNAAQVRLMRTHGLGAEDAALVVQEGFGGLSMFWVKTAADSDLLTLPELPSKSVGGFMSGHHLEDPEVDRVQRSVPSDGRDFYRYTSPFAGGDSGDDSQGPDAHDLGKGTLDVLEFAAKTGQKEVFDAAVLSSLINTRRATELVERYLPTIESGMDRLGRLLFLLYQHYEDFQERYGRTETSDLLESIESTFEQLGHISVFLKTHSISKKPSTHGLDLAGEVPKL